MLLDDWIEPGQMSDTEEHGVGEREIHNQKLQPNLIRDRIVRNWHSNAHGKSRCLANPRLITAHDSDRVAFLGQLTEFLSQGANIAGPF
jgi:arylamine N-acetyltransferase